MILSSVQRDLTGRLGIQPGSASEVIGKLEAAGYIVRTPSEADRRTTDVRLTDLGREEADKARYQREKHHEDMFSCLSADEKDTLLSILEKINHDWNQRYRGMALEKGLQTEALGNASVKGAGGGNS